MGEYELDPRVKAHYSGGTERDRMLGGGEARILADVATARWPLAFRSRYGRGRQWRSRRLRVVPLAAEGCSVLLIDPGPLHVDQAIEGSSVQR